MSLLNIFDISGSALSAQSQRMNVSASNMANADSVTGPDGEPYRAKQVVFGRGGARAADRRRARCPWWTIRRPSVWCTSRATRWRTPRATCACRTST